MSVDLAAIEPRTCIVRNTGAHRGRRISVTPENSAARYLHFGRIVLEGEEIAFNTEDRETALLVLNGAAHMECGGHAAALTAPAWPAHSTLFFRDRRPRHPIPQPRLPAQHEEHRTGAGDD